MRKKKRQMKRLNCSMAEESWGKSWGELRGEDKNKERIVHSRRVHP